MDATPTQTVKEFFKSTEYNKQKLLLENLYSILQETYTKSPTVNNKTNQSEHYQKHLQQLRNDFSIKLGEELNIIQKTSISDFFDFNQLIICQFVYSIFNIQFGWTDKCENYETVEQLSYRQNIGGTCENFITWFENHDHLSFNLLTGYAHALKLSQTSPVLRKHIIYSVFHWLKNLSSKQVLLVRKCFVVLQEIALIGLTDVWSAIRKDTASRLYLIVDLLLERELQDLFLALLQICRNQESTDTDNWQATEGAIRGINKILTSCKWVPTSSVSKDKLSSDIITSTPTVLIKIGRNTYDGLPLFIKENIEHILFKLFAHPQLSVREIAGKAYSDFLNKSDYLYFIDSFDKVIEHLQTQLHQTENKMLNAYEASGFLNAALFLIKNIPLSYVMVSWRKYWSIFSAYLKHPASTVRQASSLIFKYLVIKDLSSPFLIKFVLHYFVMDWKLNESKMKAKVNLVKESHEVDKCNNISWEWKEGCFFTYELLMKLLCTNHLYFSLSTHASSCKKSGLNKSTNEGELKLALNRSHQSQSFRRNHVPVDRRKLTKSFTMVDREINQTVPNEVEHIHEKIGSLLTLLHEDYKKMENVFSTGINDPIVIQTPELQLNCNQYINEQKILKWFSQQKYSSFQEIITQILLECIECLQDEQWELRRMSNQLLPSICDVIRYYDYSILETLYTTSAIYVDSPLYYGSCVCLLHSIKCYIKLYKNVNERVSPIKQCEKKKEHSLKLMGRLGVNMSKYIETIATNFKQCQWVDIQNCCCIIIVIYQISFHQKNREHDVIVCEYLIDCYDKVKKTSKICGTKQWKLLFELLCEVQPYLVEYIEKVDVSNTVILLPMILYILSIPSSNSIDQQIFLSCCELILQKYLLHSSTLVISSHNHLKLACEEVSNLFINKESEITYMASIFNIVLLLQSCMKHAFPMQQIEDTITKRLNIISKDKEKKSISFVKTKAPADDILSYSTASFDSMRFSDVESSDEESNDNNDNDVSEGDDSDWDWSSSDELQEPTQSYHDLLLKFQDALKVKWNSMI